MSLTTNYWPDIRRALNNNPDIMDNLQVPCQLCSRMTVPARYPFRDDVCVGMSILFCGHVFGERCWRKYSAEMGRGGALRCPVNGCNENHRYPDPSCGHIKTAFQFQYLRDLEKVPLCSREGGSTGPSCEACGWASKSLNGPLYRVCKEFDAHLTQHCRDIIDGELIFTLRTNWRQDFNMNFETEGLTEDDRHQFTITGPVEDLTEDHYDVQEDGGPTAVFPCVLLQLLRDDIRNYVRPRNYWGPMVTSVEVGVSSQIEISDEELRDVAHYIRRIHLWSTQWHAYVDRLDREEEQRNRDEATRRRNLSPGASDTSP